MKSRKHDRKTKAGTPLGAGGAKSKRDLAVRGRPTRSSSVALCIHHTPLPQNIRVLQKNLVYAVGLAAEICDEELLKGSQYFGQFGKIIKVGHLWCFVANHLNTNHLNANRSRSTDQHQPRLASRLAAAAPTSPTSVCRTRSGASRASMMSFGWVRSYPPLLPIG